MSNSRPCTSDARMLRNAEATYFVANGRYGTQAELTAARLIRATLRRLHGITPTGLSYNRHRSQPVRRLQHCRPDA